MSRILGALVGALALVALDSAVARGFALLFDPPTITDVQQELEETPRWPSLDGQTVVLNVASMPGFGAALGVTPEEVAAANQVVADAFASWESPALQFNVSLEDPGVVGNAFPNPDAGFDIDVFAVPASHPAFAGVTPIAFAVTYPSTQFVGSRLLTNGQSFAGFIIQGADIYLKIDLILLFKTGILSMDAAAVQRLLMHEVGHALGLGHPNDNNLFGAAANLDTDNDPLNAMTIDPANPFADLVVSPFPDNAAVMSNLPCGFDLPCEALYFPLQNDDLAGRDVLYPTQSAGADHYQCYKAKPFKGVCQEDLTTTCRTDADCQTICLQKFASRIVSLIDQFGSASPEVKKPRSLCAPVEKTPQGPPPQDPTLHYKRYQIKGGPSVKGQRVLARDQFGDHVIELIKEDSLYVPAAKSDVPVEPRPPGPNHYLCYKAKNKKKICTDDLTTKCATDADCTQGGICDLGFGKAPQGLTDQFGSSTVEIKKVKMFCTPVDKNAEGIADPGNHLVGYQIKGGGITANVHTNDQFGPEALELSKQEFLMVPAEKNPSAP